jgi:curved DNA-binding protein CbpA
MRSAIDPYRVLQVVATCDQEVLHAAYRALARKYHPDRDASRYAQERMAELNEAFAIVRDPASRERHDRGVRNAAFAPLSAGVVNPPPRAAAAGTRLEFGRYSGWTLRDLARQDPDYLRWLSRHASGLRYRTEIYGILGRMGATAA